MGLATNVRAFFSYGVNRTTVSASTFRLYKMGTEDPLGAQVGYDPQKRMAILNPTGGRLEPGRRYKAVITTGVEDNLGNRLDQDEDPTNGNQPKAWVFEVRK